MDNGEVSYILQNGNNNNYYNNNNPVDVNRNDNFSTSRVLDPYNECDNSTGRIETLLYASNLLLLVYPWVMMCTGTITNSISFAVLTRPKLRKSSTFFYLACLCVIDLLSLYTFCINFIFFYHFRIDLQLQHAIVCKVFSFLTYFLPQLSAWTCAAVSLDRVVGVLFSVRGKYAATAKRWNTPAKARQVMVGLFISLFALNVHFLFYPNEYQLEGDEVRIKDVNVIYCSPENIPRYQNFYDVWVHIDLLVNVLIPFFIMIASSIVIVVRILKSTQNLGIMMNSNALINRSKSLINRNSIKKATTTTSSSTNQVRFNPELSSLTNIQSQLQIKTQMTTAIVEELNSPTSSQQTPRRSIFSKRRSSAASSNVTSKAKSVSYMLAANNFVFISLTLPIVVFLSLAPGFSTPGLCDAIKAKLRLIKVICIILMNSNCSVNIFIYSFMSSEFRYQLISLFKEFCCFCGCARDNMLDSSSATVNKKLSAPRNSSEFIQPDQASKRMSSSK